MNIVITGGASGLGLALCNALRAAGHRIVAIDLAHGDNVLAPDAPGVTKLLTGHGHGEVDVLINCAGVNRIGWLEDFTELEWDHVMDVNAKGIFMMTKALLPSLAITKGTVVNIVSNAAHVPMTCSAAYNASKGAAHILTKQLARELTKKYGITVFGVAPNKLAGTYMSKAIDRQVCDTRGWTPEQAAAYQLAALPAGVETPPEAVAEFITFLLSSKERHRYLTGTVIPYGA